MEYFDFETRKFSPVDFEPRYVVVYLRNIKIANHLYNFKTQTAQGNVDTPKKEIKRHSTMIESMARSLDNIKREKVQAEKRIPVTDIQFRSMKMNLMEENSEIKNNVSYGNSLKTR